MPLACARADATRLHMLDLNAGKGRQVIKCAATLGYTIMILRYISFRARGVCALESSSFFAVLAHHSTFDEVCDEDCFDVVVDKLSSCVLSESPRSSSDEWP